MPDELDEPRLTSGMLMMRRHEKDFMLRRDPKYIAEVKKAAVEFSKAIDQTKADGTRQLLVPSIKGAQEELRRAQKDGWHACPHPSLPAHDLEALVVGQIQAVGRDTAVQTLCIGSRIPVVSQAGGLETGAQIVLEGKVFLQEFGVFLLGEPARTPGLVEAEAKSVRMYFLSHSISPPPSRRAPPKGGVRWPWRRTA